MTDNDNSRYPGLVPFNEQQHTLFFGRDKETAELYNFIVAEQTIVLFAKSGAGKSSLLHAGLFPLLRKNGYHPVKVRFQYTVDYRDSTGASSSTSRTPLQILFDTLEQRSNDRDDVISINKEIILHDKQSPRLWEYLKAIHLPSLVVPEQPVVQENAVQAERIEAMANEQANANAAGFRNFIRAKRETKRTPVLVFDQFEEFFNFPETDRHAFMQQLCEVLHSLPPNRIGEWLRSFKLSERTPQMMEWAKQPVVKCIIAIRDDKLSELDSLRKYIPLILKNRYRLAPLSRDNAKQAMEQPAALEGDFISPRFTFDPLILDRILLRLSGSDLDDKIEAAPYKKSPALKPEATAPPANEGIDGSQLQQVCSHIEQKVIEKHSKTKKPVVVDKTIIDPDVDVQDILDTFYEKQLTTVGTAKQIELCRTVIQEYLVSGRSRASLTRNQIYERLQGDQALLDKMLQARLIKREYTHLGETYELSHDSLIRSVIRSARLKRMNTLTKENKTQRNQKKLFFALFILSIISLAVAIRGAFRNYEMLNSNNLNLATYYYDQNNHYTAFNIWNSFPEKLFVGRDTKDRILSIMDSLYFFDISGGDKLVRLRDSLFAVHEKDNTIHLWQIPRRGDTLRLETLTDAHNLEVSDSKKYLGYRTRAGKLIIYDIALGDTFSIREDKVMPLPPKQRLKRQAGQAEYRMNFMKGADLVAFIDSTAVYIYDLANRQRLPLRIVPTDNEKLSSDFIVSDMKISADKKFLALHKRDSFKVLDLQNLKVSVNAPVIKDFVTQTYFTAAGNSVCYVKRDSFIVIPFNNIANRTNAYRVRMTGKPYFSPRLDKCLFYNTNFDLVVFDLEQHRADTVMGFSDKRSGQMYMQSRNFAVPEWGEDGDKIYYQSQNSQRTIYTVQQQRQMRTPGSYSPDGKYYCRLTRSGVLKVWERKTGRVLFTDSAARSSYQGPEVGEDIDAGSDVVRFSENGNLLAYQVINYNDQGYLKIVDVSTGEMRYQSPDLWRIGDFFTNDLIAVYDVFNNPGVIFLNGQKRNRQYYQRLYPSLTKQDRDRLGIRKMFSIRDFF